MTHGPALYRPSLAELFLASLKVGTIGFGGHAALVAVVERELAEKRRFFSSQAVVDAVALTAVLPGPLAINTVAALGYLCRGLGGALAAATGLVLPSFTLMVMLALFYERVRALPHADEIMNGVLPVVVGIIVALVLRLAQKECRVWEQWVIASVSFVAMALHGGIWIVGGLILVSATVGSWWRSTAQSELLPTSTVFSETPLAPRWHLSGAVLALLAFWVAMRFDLLPVAPLLKELWSSFAAASLLMFGGGYVFVPVLKHIVVTAHGWMDQQAFTDAIAFGQITPGPIIISVAFIGFRAGALLGAVVGTAAICLPPALFTLIAVHAMGALSKSRLLGRAFFGIRPCVVGMIASAAVVIGRSVPHDLVSCLLILGTVVAIKRWNLPSFLLVALGGVVRVTF